MLNLSKYKEVINSDLSKHYGKVSKVVGLTIESDGPASSIGEICDVKAAINNNVIKAEVVGFKEGKILLMPYGTMEGISSGSVVEATRDDLKIKVGEGLLGRVIDGLGNPIDGKGDFDYKAKYSVTNESPDPLTRARISEKLLLGVKAIDSMLTIGKGQRVGIFAGSGVGKSTLLGMIARNTLADINVIALIGERGREVREFIEKDLGEEGLKRSVLIVATSDKPALIRKKAAETATAVAEYFRDQGKDVLLMMDSLTRYSMAQREIGLAIGEPPVSKGYTPSVFAVMPKLLERAGTSHKGSITGLYTVLVEGDDLSEPVTDTARGILDGHIVLSRKLANKNHYPAISVLESVSRVMGDVVTQEHKDMSFEVKKVLAVYNDAEDLINIGAYSKGSNPEIDYAIEKIGLVKELLQQKTHEFFGFEEIMEKMQNILQNE
ncbi:MAG: flagellar protein export ATPase FliI [Clostridia bacterium]|jgi:flagellum-specific ATP synthase|nr:flagellar protein export ATPase FliI [Clostridia bacterium]